MKTITKALGIEHRFSTPYHPRGNGAAENAVKVVVSTLRKLLGNDTSKWDDMLPVAQLCCNYKIRNRTASSPFSLMYTRQLSTPKDYSNPSINKNSPRKMVTEEELVQRAETMAKVVFPAIAERTRKIVEEQSKKFDKKHYLIDIPNDTTVMVKLPNRATKLSPLYEGPFTVVRKTMGGTYVLKDEMNELLHRDYVPSELKVVNIDESSIEDELFEVDEIRDHKDNAEGEREYLIKWIGYGERENSWLPAESFSSPETIRKYWTKVRELEKLEQERKAKLVKVSEKVIRSKETTKTVKRQKKSRKEAMNEESSVQKRRSRRNQK
ncbi:hypothetical protein INT47_000261 [Mucor saturninus]|uniref:Uncharacterized protein n=1 Tax=Mucor saturninus TaxID=64648 RepID=A0A8H7UMD4_9FUNG|nr:hypothetical protein INT47_000261 [Mucor saturninus]